MSCAEEKRKRIRVEYVIDSYFKPDGNEKIKCLLNDLSMSGFFACSKHRLDLHTKGEMQIQLTSGEEVKIVNAKCIVSRCEKNENGYGIGFEITQIDPDSSIILFNMIKFQLR